MNAINTNFIPNDNADEPNLQRRYEVTRADLPVSCPLPSVTLWNAHPRVYIPVEETGQAVCPYCSAEFILIDKND